MMKSIDLFPLTIIRDPYDGKFSGGKYLAINQNYNSISPYINEYKDYSQAWWENESHNYIIGPVFDFQQALLSMGEDVEVLAPQWLRDEMAEKIKRMNHKYNVDK